MPRDNSRLMTVSTATSLAGTGSWPRGYLRPCLLPLIAESPCHGYDLLDRLEKLGAPPIDAGTLSAAIYAAWGASSWSTHEGDIAYGTRTVNISDHAAWRNRARRAAAAICGS